MPHPLRTSRRFLSKINRAINPFSLRGQLREMTEFWDDQTRTANQYRSEVFALKREADRRKDGYRQMAQSHLQAKAAAEAYMRWLEFDEALMNFIESDPETYLVNEMQMWGMALQQLRQRMASLASGYAQTRSDRLIRRY